MVTKLSIIKDNSWKLLCLSVTSPSEPFLSDVSLKKKGGGGGGFWCAGSKVKGGRQGRGVEIQLKKADPIKRSSGQRTKFDR